MRHRLFWILGCLTTLAAAAPACASDGVTLPEPGTVSLISLAMAGVVIGRRMSSKRPPEG